jgi:hypothetical protein
MSESKMIQDMNEMEIKSCIYDQLVIKANADRTIQALENELINRAKSNVVDNGTKQ